MQDKDVSNLLKLGLTEGESKVYLALIELGSSTVGPIVKKALVAYSNVYEILERLMEKGIVSYIIKNKTKYFQAANPTNLLDYIIKKEEEINDQKVILKDILPRLVELQKLKPQQSAEVFLGKKGLKSAYEKLVADSKSGDNFFYIHEEAYAEESDLFYFGIQNLLKKIPLRGIANKLARKSEFIKKSKFIEARYVDFPIPGNIEVCGNRVLMVSWEKPIIAVLVHSQSIADNLNKYFEDVWKVAKK